IAAHFHSYDSSAGRDLMADKVGFVETCAPERPQAAMRRTTDRVFVHADGRSEKPRYEIETRVTGSSRHDDAPRRNCLELCIVWPQLTDGMFRGELRQNVEPVAAEVERLGTERRVQLG